MEKLLQAIYFATNKHLNQKRKDKITPYIEHPLAVALILTQFTKDQDILVAGILHDVIEDTDATEKELLDIFGEKVTKIVIGCSDQNKDLSWEVRKEKTLDKIKTLDDSTALVKAADTLHNMYEAVQKVKVEGADYFKNFKTGGEAKLKHERKRIEELKKHHGKIAFLDEIEKCVEFLENSLIANEDIK